MLVAFKSVSAEPFAAGSVAGNLASGTVPEVKLSAFRFAKSTVWYSKAVAPALTART